ncbi:hypothetical protein [Sciscionella marina]|uniref:pPIWI_RE_Y domain-containing protein n=1 Tax=Sciscionella marina TaxID=508770 RepID=UPI00036BD9BF|nr:hypothetical protein [Sciscionella marina]
MTRIIREQDDLNERQARVVAAALRAAYAWSVRQRQPDAMREIARMTGVMMEAHGPGRGPTSPMQLVEQLRRPLGTLLRFASDTDTEVTDVVLLDTNDALSDDAIGVAAEYATPLSQVFATSQWLPGWTRMRAEQLRREVFTSLIEAGDAAGYVRARRFLVEHPAGFRARLQDLLREADARLAARYRDLASDQQYPRPVGRWWWPCPRCRWPMTVRGMTVRCRYRPHGAIFHIADNSRPAAAPRLVPVRDASSMGTARKAGPAARSVEDAVCVEEEVWRSVVVPGANEVRLADELCALGAKVALWPELDSYDLDVAVGSLRMLLDVKEYTSVRRLIDDLRERPPRAQILLPRSHEHQEALLAEQSSVRVTTETKVRRAVRRAAREA